jgi:hypothetical protein
MWGRGGEGRGVWAVNSVKGCGRAQAGRRRSIPPPPRLLIIRGAQPACTSPTLPPPAQVAPEMQRVQGRVLQPPKVRRGASSAGQLARSRGRDAGRRRTPLLRTAIDPDKPSNPPQPPHPPSNPHPPAGLRQARGARPRHLRRLEPAPGGGAEGVAGGAQQGRQAAARQGSRTQRRQRWRSGGWAAAEAAGLQD